MQKKIVKFNGGLGNQMFQYAFGMFIAKKTKSEVIFDFSYFDEQPLDKNVPIRPFELNSLHTNCIRATDEDLSKVKKPEFKIKLERSASKYLPQLFGVNYAKEKYSFTKDYRLLLCPHYYYEGYFQCPKYFQRLRKELLKDFSLAVPLDEKNKEMLEKIKNTNSVSVHIRRGDYVNVECVKAIHGNCSDEYYQQAIKYICEKVENPHFFFFSDDIEWVKQNTNLDIEYTIVDFNQDKGYFDMELMKNCKHNIIANSSFSWWGGWLNENPEKIVIAPKHWTLQKQLCDIVPKGWIKI